MTTDIPPRSRPAASAEEEAGKSVGLDAVAPTTPPALWSGRRRAWLGGVGFALVAWFFVAWRVLHREFLDAAGESVGSAFALLLLVSLVGAFRGGH